MTDFKFEVGQAVKFALRDDNELEYGKTGVIVENEALNPNLNDAARQYAEQFPYRVVWDDGEQSDPPELVKLMLAKAREETGINFGVGWIMAEDELEAIQ